MAHPRTLNFKVKELTELPPAKTGKRYRVHHPTVTGFFLEITDKGTKTFKFRKRMGRKVQIITMGRFPEFKISAAKRRAIKYAGEMVEGINPQEMKLADRLEITFGQMFDEYMERHAKPHKKSWKQDETCNKLHLDKLKNRQLSSVVHADILARHLAVRDSAGPYSANRMLALVHCVFEKADEWGFYTGKNPARKVKRFREQSRDRFLQADEIPRFFKALAADDNETIKDFLLVCLLTGARRANVQSMSWDQLNIERGTWTIPETKSGHPHTVPLVPEALTILQDRLANSEDSTWVFPGTGRTGHLVEIKTAWRRIIKRAKIENLRIHDLRRTLGSWQAATGSTLAIIGKTLAHRNISTTLIYSRLNIDPVRDSMNRATSAIFEAGHAVEDEDATEGTANA
jgi:integrase